MAMLGGCSFNDVLVLFDEGVASPFSVEATSGQTLLHVSNTRFYQDSSYSAIKC
jgi:hypothetical protein